MSFSALTVELADSALPSDTTATLPVRLVRKDTTKGCQDKRFVCHVFRKMIFFVFFIVHLLPLFYFYIF